MNSGYIRFCTSPAVRTWHNIYTILYDAHQIKHPCFAVKVKLALTPEDGTKGSNTCGTFKVNLLPPLIATTVQATNTCTSHIFSASEVNALKSSLSGRGHVTACISAMDNICIIHDLGTVYVEVYRYFMIISITYAYATSIFI